MKKKKCIFCEIINGKAEGSIVYEDELVMAFLDAFPLNPGHLLVVSKAHAKDIAVVDQHTFARMAAVAQNLATALIEKKLSKCAGVNLFMANSKAAGQEIMHAHLHVIPRKNGDGIRFARMVIPDKSYAIKPVTLRTERLVLRPFTLSDAPDVQHLAGEYDIASTTSIPHPYPDGVADEWIRSHRKNLQEAKAVNLAIIKHDDNALIGSIGLLNIKLRGQQAELGCWIGKPYWKAGFATEATRAVIRYGFETLGLNRISGCHMTRNPASGRIFEKLGMKKEGILRQATRKWGKFEDIAVYGLLRSEFMEHNEK